jgi:ribonuclease HI
MSNGFRPRRDRALALAIAERLAVDRERFFLATADVVNAFPSLPTQRVLQVVRHYLPNNQLVELISKLVRRGVPRGIVQGQPLSPLLLNIYFHHLIDLEWRCRHGDIPLIRVADDFLLLCRSWDEAQSAVIELQAILQQIGVRAKGNPIENIRDVRDDTVDWLGARIRLRETTPIETRLAPDAYAKLGSRLSLLHDHKNPPVACLNLIEGWLAQQGMLITDPSELSQAINLIRAAAAAESFEELPTTEQLTEIAARSQRRFQQLRRLVQEHPSLTSTVEVASQPMERHETNDRVDWSAPPSTRNVIVVYTDGAFFPRQRIGGWAFIIRRLPASSQIVEVGSEHHTTNNRMELMAVIAALSRIENNNQVSIVTDSEYVGNLINGRLQNLYDTEQLFPRGPLTADLPNRDLLQRLYDQISRMTCAAEVIRGHSGHTENEICDQLARDAALDELYRRR